MDLLPFGPGMRPDKRLAGPQRPSFAEALRFWFKLGCISFGGTAAHIAIMQDELVEKKRWISNGSFLHALSHCMMLPGPEAQQLAIYIGWKLHGKRGGIVAGTLFVLPSLFVLLALSVIYVRFGSLPWIAAMFNGLKPVVIALVIVALQRIARRALRGPVQGAVAVATFAAMSFFYVSLLVVMFGAVLLHFCRSLPFLARPRTVLHQDRLRNRWRLVHGDSLRGEGYGVEAPLADEVPNDRWFRTGGNDARTSDYSGCFCRLHRGVQPLPRLIVDGNSRPRGNDLLYVSSVFPLCLCRCAACGTNPRQAHNRRRSGADHRSRGRRDSRPDAFSRESGNFVIRSCGSQAHQSALSGLGDAVASPAPEIQTQDHSTDPAGYWVRFDAVFSRLVKDTRQNFRLVGGSQVIRLGIVRIRLHRSENERLWRLRRPSDLLKQKLALPPGFTYKWSGE